MSNWDKYLTTGIPVHKGARMPLRKELNDLSDEEMFLYLEGLKGFQNEDMAKPLSYYQIAGIHGLPYTTWPNESWNTDIKQVFNREDFGGFCTHSSVLFLSWHRPYLALYESALYAHVNVAADSIDPKSPEKAKYQQIAKNFRMPYWDWARRNVSPFPKAALNSTAYPNNKDFFKSPNFKGPQMTRDPKAKDDYNPLFTFPFPKDTIKELKTIEWYEQPKKIGERPKMIGDRVYESTVRYPVLSGDSTPQNVLEEITGFFKDQSRKLTGKWRDAIPRNLERNLSERVAYILKSYERFGPMSYNAFPRDARGEAGKAEIWGSLEDIHNSVHGLIGHGGHMGKIPTSAYDPIFWLHHTNIDRLFAIWQALHESNKPETYVTKQSASGTSFAKLKASDEDEDTPLWPFRITSKKDDWWTSQKAKRTEDFGYAYPEIAGWQYPGLSDARAKLTETINEYYSNLPNFISLSKRRVETAGASLLPQAALLKKLDETQVTANITEMRRIDAELPEPQVLLQQSLEPEKPFLRDLAPNNKYLEWLVDIKAEKHALDGSVQVHVFLGPVQEDDVALWPFSPNHVGTFATLGQGDQTACAKCQQDQADRTQVTGQIPLTLALTERYLAQIIPDLTEDTVIPYLTTSLHWRIALTNGGTVPNRGAVPGLKVFVVSNEVTVSEDPNVPPVYAPDVKIYPEITTNRDGQGRGEGSGLIAAEVPA